MKREKMKELLQEKLGLEYGLCGKILDVIEEAGMTPPPIKRRGWTTWVVNEWSDEEVKEMR